MNPTYHLGEPQTQTDVAWWICTWRDRRDLLMASLTAAWLGGPFLGFGTYFVKSCRGDLPSAIHFPWNWPSISAGKERQFGCCLFWQCVMYQFSWRSASWDPTLIDQWWDWAGREVNFAQDFVQKVAAFMTPCEFQNTKHVCIRHQASFSLIYCKDVPPSTLCQRNWCCFEFALQTNQLLLPVCASLNQCENCLLLNWLVLLVIQRSRFTFTGSINIGCVKSRETCFG